MPDTNIVIVGRFRVHPDDAVTFTEILRPHVADVTANTPGCVYYDFAVDVTDPALFRNMEGWVNQQALDDHLGSAGFAATITEVMDRVRILDQSTQLYQVAAQRALILGGS